MVIKQYAVKNGNGDFLHIEALNATWKNFIRSYMGSDYD